MRSFQSVLILSMLITGPVTANAVILNPTDARLVGSGTRECYNGNDCTGTLQTNALTQSTTFSSQGSNSSTYGALNLSKSPSATTYATSGVPGGNSSALSYSTQAGTRFDLHYYIEVDGPNNSIRAPVRFDAHAKLGVTGGEYMGGSSADASVFLYLGSTDAYRDKHLPNETLISREINLDYSDGDTSGSKTSGFDYDGFLDLYTNTPYEILFRVSANTNIGIYKGATNIGPMTASATLDPSFTLAPGLVGYSLAYSQGLFPSGPSPSPVPLPGSFPLFGAALFAIGAIGYGVKRERGAAAG